MKRLCVYLLGCLLFFFSQAVFAEDLLQVYQQALKMDPQFKSAEAEWLAARQLIPIARSYLLPNLSSNGAIAKAWNNNTVNDETTRFSGASRQYTLSLTQNIFNYQVWAQLQNAKAQSKEAFANYNAALQNLMVRVANAYFGVLQAYDTLQATEATKRSLVQQLQQTEEQYKVGLIAVTGVDQVKASYDLILAQEIANKNNVSDKLEELRAITGVFYTRLAGIKIDLPLVSPQPEDINAWVLVAARQNFTLQAAYFAMISAQENVQVQRGGHYPVVVAGASYAYDKESAINGGSIGDIQGTIPGTIKSTTVGIQANFPIYEGGIVTAQTRQASYQYAQASAQREQTYRQTTSQTRESYLGVIAGISKIKADRQSIASNQSSLNATKAGYTVGTNTIVDVLQQQSNLYTAQTTFAADQYNYLISTLNLKEAAGTLGVSDLAKINSWLDGEINLSAFDFNMTPPTYESNDSVTTTPPPAEKPKKPLPKKKSVKPKKTSHPTKYSEGPVDKASS